MNHPSFDQIVGLLIQNERHLSELRQSLSQLDRKVDSLVQQIAWNQSGIHSPVSTNYQGVPLGIFSDPYSARANFDFGTLSDPDMLPPRTAPASMVYLNGVWTDPPPSTSTVVSNPALPAMTPSNEMQGQEAYDGGNDNGGEGNVYPSVEEWTSVSAQVAETSTSLAAAKPDNIEDNVWSEQSTPVASSSSSGYDRNRNAEERSLRFARICEVQGITQPKDELSTLRAIIKSMGIREPNVGGSTDEMTGADPNRGREMRRAIHACYQVLQDMVGPPGDKIAYNRVLSNVLARVTMEVDEPRRDDWNQYGVYRLGNW